MPFCEACARYWTPTAMKSDGTCPSCGRHVQTSGTPTAEVGESHRRQKIDVRALASDGGEDVSAPWHFKLLVAGLVLYLTWRIVDLFI